MRIPNFNEQLAYRESRRRTTLSFHCSAWGLHTLSKRLLVGHAVIWRGSSYFKPDKLAEDLLTVPRGVNIHYENLDHTLNYLYLRRACLVGAARNQTPAPV